jgi:hypothetical protein
MAGLGSWSQTRQDYINSDKRVDITISDYNGYETGFAGISAIYAMGFSSENDSKKEGSVDLGIKDVVAYETIYKKEPRSKLVLIVADRFFVELDSDGNNDENFLRGIAKNMKLPELAGK